MHRVRLLASLAILASEAVYAQAAGADSTCARGDISTVFIPTTVYVTVTAPASSPASPNPALPSTRDLIVPGSSISASTPSSYPPGDEVSPIQTSAKPELPPPPPPPPLVPTSEEKIPKWVNKTAQNATATATSPLEKVVDTPTSRVDQQVETTSSIAPGVMPSGSVSVSGARNVLYFTNWGIYGAKFEPQNLPADRVTHVLYAFGDIAADGSVISSDTWSDEQKRFPGDSWDDTGRNVYGCVKQLYLHKTRNRRLKTLLSIGGWTYSQAGKFSRFAGTEAGRARFAASAIKLMGDWGMDGIDIDWEYPKDAAEARQFVLLLKACREALDGYAATNKQKYHYLLTVASPAGPQNYGRMELAAMDRYLDAWHLMAYDYAGSWDNTTGHQANLFPDAAHPERTKFNTERAVSDYLKAGISGNKIVLGLPLYGRSFTQTSGMGEPYEGVGQGSIERGVWLYRDLPRPGAVVQLDKTVGAAWSYDAASRQLVTHDTVESAKLKVDYLRQRRLGGALFWEAAGDKTGDQSIVRAVADAMANLDNSPNQLEYPASQYDNLRKGMPET